MSDQTTYSPGVSKLRGRYERQMEAGNLAGAFGDTGRSEGWGRHAARTLAMLNRRGGNTEGLDIADFSGEFDPTSAQTAIADLSRRGGQVNNRANVLNQNKLSGLLESRGLERRQGEFDENILPTYTGAMDRLNELAGTNAISAEQEGLMRSKIAATNRRSAASNLGRVSSALGLRGMADSPAAAALASSVAQDYDIDLQNSLADMGLKVTELNREQTRQDSGAAAALATLRINAENAYLAKDTEAVQQIGRDTAALIDALYSRDKTFELMERQLDEAGAGGSGAAGALSGAASGAVAGAPLGPWGMVGGAVLGGASGYLGGR